MKGGGGGGAGAGGGGGSVPALPVTAHERFDISCFNAGSDMASRDASCKGDLVCARKGSDSRDFGDCPEHHCCSMPVTVHERFDSGCWTAGSDMASRDASCKGDLVCAMKGHENRQFGDCPKEHCCSLPVTVHERFDSGCWEAGSDMASRDASCKGDLVCAMKGHENRQFGDCPHKHCCSLLVTVHERFDSGCWKAGSDMASRDASCKGDLVCARNGDENRQFGDCPHKHCCSLKPTSGALLSKASVTKAKTIYGVGDDSKVYKQFLGGMKPASAWELAGDGPMRSITIDGDTIFGIGSDMKLYKQPLTTMSPSSAWALAAGSGDVLSAAVHDGTIYAVGIDYAIYKQSLSAMSTSSAWSWAGKGAVSFIAISGDEMYGIASDDQVYKQPLSSISKGSWSLAGSGYVASFTMDGDTVYGAGRDKRVYTQTLSKMSASSPWSPAGNGKMSSLAIAR